MLFIKKRFDQRFLKSIFNFFIKLGLQLPKIWLIVFVMPFLCSSWPFLF